MVEHPEGGCYVENYRSEIEIRSRSLATSIHFLLKQGEVSHFHQIKSDELWFFHEGAPCTIHCFDLDGNYIKHDLGVNFSTVL